MCDYRRERMRTQENLADWISTYFERGAPHAIGLKPTNNRCGKAGAAV
jgi:hypothetical protein